VRGGGGFERERERERVITIPEIIFLVTNGLTGLFQKCFIQDAFFTRSFK
jgi:hypothetical protein